MAFREGRLRLNSIKFHDLADGSELNVADFKNCPVRLAYTPKNDQEFADLLHFVQSELRKGPEKNLNEDNNLVNFPVGGTTVFDMIHVKKALHGIHVKSKLSENIQQESEKNEDLAAHWRDQPGTSFLDSITSPDERPGQIPDKPQLQLSSEI